MKLASTKVATSRKDPRPTLARNAIDTQWEEENDSCALTGAAARLSALRSPLLPLSSFDQISR